MTSTSVMSDEATAASLRKSGRTRKRPLPPDATYDQSPTSASKTNGMPHGGPAAIPFSPRKLFGGTVEQPAAGSSTATQTRDGNENGNVGEGEEQDDEDEQEEEPVWAEFSADYYQVVEQLPLELHRNFALLRELDEQTQRQTSQLLELIRQYANARLATVQPNADHLPGDPSKNPQTDLSQPLPDISTLQPPGQDAMDIDTPNNLPRTPGKGPPDEGSDHIAAGPSRHVDAIPEAHTDISGNVQASGNRLYSVKLTSNMLPQIGQLARDVLRGADEKVGIASGCYNTVDRHVRSMDAALQVQQAAVNLGIQEGTLPSEMITGSTGLGASGATRADGQDAQEAMGIFSGGRERGLNGTAGDGLAIDGLNVGLAESRMGAGRANEDDRGPIPIVAGHVAAQNFDLKVDPNEPRYCYCDNVSFGEMIGCENDDCPHGGWFHLTCVGMNTAPKDKWWCSSCKPADENAIGGSSRGKKGRSKKKTKR